MKYAYSALAFGLGASAAVIAPRQAGCCFQIDVNGATSGPLGQLADGQNRVGTGFSSSNAATYCLNAGGITDSSGRGCILTAPTTQFQCDMGASPTTGFTITSNGEIEYNGSGTFYECEASAGVFNIYTAEGGTNCSPITLSTVNGACAAASSAPAPASATSLAGTTTVLVPATQTVVGPTQTVVGPTQTAVGPTQTVVGPTQTVVGPIQTVVGPTLTVTAPAETIVSTVVSTVTPAGSVCIASSAFSSLQQTLTVTNVQTATEVQTSAPAGSTCIASSAFSALQQTQTVVQTVTGPGATVTQKTTEVDHVTGPGATVTGPGVTVTGPGVTVTGPGVTVTGPGVTVTGPGVTVTGPGLTVTETAISTAPGATIISTAIATAPASTIVESAPASQSTLTIATTATISNSAPTAAPPAASTACPAALTGSYEIPHLIVPVNSTSPSQSYGTSYNGIITPTVSSIFNFDIPASYSGQTCSLVFLLPVQADLVTSSFTLSGSGGIQISELASPADQSTTFDTAPKVSADLGTFEVAPGSSTVIATSACAAGETLSYELSATGSYALTYFQDYNPSPIGLFITQC